MPQSILLINELLDTFWLSLSAGSSAFFCSSLTSSTFEKDADQLECPQKREAKLLRALESKSCKERLKEPGLFRLEEKRLMMTFKNLKGHHIEKGQTCLLLPQKAGLGMH